MKNPTPQQTLAALARQELINRITDAHHAKAAYDAAWQRFNATAPEFATWQASRQAVAIAHSNYDAATENCKEMRFT